MSEHNGKDTYDFVLKGARVIDPYNQIDGMLDLAVSNNKIAGIGENLGGAKETHDVTGKIVVPGMIDTHAHVFEYVSGRFGLNPDMVGVQWAKLHDFSWFPKIYSRTSPIKGSRLPVYLHGRWT